MKKATFNTLLVGGGFLLGTAGIKGAYECARKEGLCACMAWPACKELLSGYG